MRIRGTGLVADGASNSASAILISHYHGDHVQGVERCRPGTPILCSSVTGALLTTLAGLPPEQIRALKPGDATFLHDGEAEARITALEANHCPGAVMFHIETRGRRILYTGDFRLNDAMRRQIAQIAGVDELYLDATYNDPRYRFPPMETAIESVLDLMRRRDGRDVLLAVYRIGKNRILEAARREFGYPFYTTKERLRIYRAIGMADLVTADRDATPFRAYARGYLEKYFRMGREYREGNFVAIVPTGWAVDVRPEPGFHYVPYSEHCDYAELQEFREIVQPKRVKLLHG